MLIVLFGYFWGMAACGDGVYREEVEEMKSVKMRTLEQVEIPNYSLQTERFDWEKIDWMPTPSGGIRIPVPWVGQGSIVADFPLEIVNDRSTAEGWELVYSTFTTKGNESLKNPYFVLYNKFRGILRIYIYLTEDSLFPDRWLRDRLAVAGRESSMLNFMVADVVDVSSCVREFSVGEYPEVGLKWYMFQYELAYDYRIGKVPYDDIQLKWFLERRKKQENDEENGVANADVCAAAYFWVPGTEIPENAPGYTPLYNEPLGILNVEGNLEIDVDWLLKWKCAPNAGREGLGEMYDCFVFKEKDFSSNIGINPAVKAIADVEINWDVLVALREDDFRKVCDYQLFDGREEENPIERLVYVNPECIKTRLDCQRERDNCANTWEVMAYRDKVQNPFVCKLRCEVRVVPHGEASEVYFVKEFCLKPRYTKRYEIVDRNPW